MAKIDLTSPEWCELIFQGKNKAYGAYKMRAPIHLNATRGQW